MQNGFWHDAADLWQIVSSVTWLEKGLVMSRVHACPEKYGVWPKLVEASPFLSRKQSDRAR